MVKAWETSIKTKGTPLLTFFENWNKINKIQKRKKVSKNDEIAGELPMIKRPKINEEKANDVSEKKGPMVLFPSDSEDENVDFKIDEQAEEPNKKVKKLKKKVKKQKVKKTTPELDNIPDKDDVVKDFSVTDW